MVNLVLFIQYALHGLIYYG